MLRFRPKSDIPEGQQPAVGVGTTYTLPDARVAERARTCSTAPRAAAARPSRRSTRWACATRRACRSTRRPTCRTPRGSARTPARRASTRRPVDLRERVADRPRRQLRLALLHGQRPGLPRPHGRRAVRTTNAPGYVSGGPATGGTDGWYDCDNIVNDSPNNTGLTTLPHETGTGKDAGTMRPRQRLVEPRHRRRRLPDLPARPRRRPTRRTTPPPRRRCARTCISQGMTVMNGPVYRYDDRRDGQRAPLAGVLGRPLVPPQQRRPERQARPAARPGDGPGRQPAGLRGQPALRCRGRASYMDSKFGPDGALYVQTYDGFFRAGPQRRHHAHTATWAAPNTPSANPTAEPVASRTIKFSSAGSGGVSSWSGTSATARSRPSANPQHEYEETGKYNVKLTVTYADGETTSRRSPSRWSSRPTTSRR